MLLVEDGNSRARKLYRKLGYKELPGGVEEEAVTLRVEAGRVVERSCVNVALRKSLKPFPAGALENASAADAAAFAVAAAAVAWASQQEDLVQLAMDSFPSSSSL